MSWNSLHECNNCGGTLAQDDPNIGVHIREKPQVQRMWESLPRDLHQPVPENSSQSEEQCRYRDTMADMAPVFVRHMKMHSQLKKLRLEEETLCTMATIGMLQNFDQHLFLLRLQILPCLISFVFVPHQGREGRGCYGWRNSLEGLLHWPKAHWQSG